jgi:hypothetical protein
MPFDPWDHARRKAQETILSDNEDSGDEDIFNLYNFGIRFKQKLPTMKEVNPWSEYHPARDRHKFYKLEMVQYSMYYTSPYLTCKECNTINFVDALALEMHLRNRLEVEEFKAQEELYGDLPDGDDSKSERPKLLRFLKPEQLVSV